MYFSRFHISGLALCSLLICAQVPTSLHRYFVNDDYLLLYTAWMQSEGMKAGRDFFIASFSPMIDLMAPLFNLFPESYLPAYIGRILMIACLCVIAWAISEISRSLFGGHARFLAPLLFLSSSPVIHRAIDLRPDLISTMFTVLIVLLLVKHPRPAGKIAFWIGILAGIAVVNRFKAIVFLPGLAAAIAWGFCHQRATWPERARGVIKTGATVSFGMCLPVVICSAYLAQQGTLGTYAAATFRLLQDGGSFDYVTGNLRSDTLLEWFRADSLFLALLVASIAAAFIERKRVGTWGPPALVLLSTAAILVTANPAFYAYNLVSLSALFAPFAAWPMAIALDRARNTKMNPSVVECAAVAALAVFPLTRLGDILLYATIDSARHQRAFTSFLLRNTAPESTVYAMEGIGLFRRSNFHWRMPMILRPWYERGGWSLTEEWNAQQPEIIVMSYRVPRWLTDEDQLFLKHHYVALTPLLLVPGYLATSTEGTRIEVLAPGEFEVISTGACALEGRPLENRKRIQLPQGLYDLTASNGECILRRPYSEQAVRDLENVELRPYLYPPELHSPIN